MPITTTCPHCGEQRRILEGQFGFDLICRKCKDTYLVSEENTELPGPGEAIPDRRFQAALVLALIGFVVEIVLFAQSIGGPTAVSLAIAARLVLLVPIGIAICLLLAKILNTGYGDLRSALVKLGAVFLFPDILILVALLIVSNLLPDAQPTGVLTIYTAAFVAYAIAVQILIFALFDLEGYESVIVAVVILCFQWGVVSLFEKMGANLLP
jgi:hypothetical protein